jgi:hypothetical protein
MKEVEVVLTNDITVVLEACVECQVPGDATDEEIRQIAIRTMRDEQMAFRLSEGGGWSDGGNNCAEEPIRRMRYLTDDQIELQEWP